MKHYYLIVLFAILFSCGKKEVKKVDPVVEVPVKKDTIVEVVVIEEEPKAPELIYTVQIAALDRPSKSYGSIENVKLYEEGGYYKYRYGAFKTYKEARKSRWYLIETYDGAFVQALKDGQPIHILDALNN